MPLSREFYIPKGATKVEHKSLPVVFYIEDRSHDNTARVASAMCFIGKQSKPAWYYGFTSREHMQRHIDKQIESVQKTEERKAQEREERKKPHTLKVGDILVNSWGYDQTNVDFYKVKRLIGKTMVELIGIRSAHIKGTEYPHGMACEVTALPDEEYGEPFRKKASHRNHVTINSFSSAWPWDGKPQYRSWYA